MQQQQQPDRYFGGTPYTLRDVGQSTEKRHQDGDQGAHQAGPQATTGTLKVADLGSGQGNGRSQTL